MRLFLIFDQMIIPGMFFYWQFREKFLKEDLNVVKLVIDKRKEEARSRGQSQYFLPDGRKSSSHKEEYVSKHTSSLNNSIGGDKDVYMHPFDGDKPGVRSMAISFRELRLI